MRAEKRIYERALLVELVNDKHSCLILKPCNRRIELQPKYLKEVRLGVKEALDLCLNKYDYSLNGILLDYQKLSVVVDNNSGRIVGKCGEFVVSVKGEFFVFQPEIGNLLKGVVNVKSDSHVGCLVHKRFNAMILKPEDVELKDWNCKNVQIGDEIVFEIVDHVFSGHVPFIEGKIAGEYLEKKLRKKLKKSKRSSSSGEHIQHNGSCSIEDNIFQNVQKTIAEFDQENCSGFGFEEMKSLVEEPTKVSPKKKKSGVEEDKDEALTVPESHKEKKKKAKKDKDKTKEKEKKVKKSEKSMPVLKMDEIEPDRVKSSPKKNRKSKDVLESNSPREKQNSELLSTSKLMEVESKNVKETEQELIGKEMLISTPRTTSQKRVAEEKVQKSAKKPKLEMDFGLKQRLILDMLQSKATPSKDTPEKPVTTSTPKTADDLSPNKVKTDSPTIGTPKSVVNSSINKDKKDKNNSKSKIKSSGKISENEKERKSMINALLDSVKQSLGIDDAETEKSENKKDARDPILRWLRKSVGKSSQEQKSFKLDSSRVGSSDSGFNSSADRLKI